MKKWLSKILFSGKETKLPCKNYYHVVYDRESREGNGHYIKESCPACGKRVGL